MKLQGQARAPYVTRWYRACYSIHRILFPFVPDGSGYPFGSKQDQIDVFAKIIAIADTFDAINSTRAYKKSKGPFEALEIIQTESHGKLDYEYCTVFLEHMINYYIGENVLLNTNNICKIVFIDINDIIHPLLIDGSEFIDLKKNKNLYIETLVL